MADRKFLSLIDPYIWGLFIFSLAFASSIHLANIFEFNVLGKLFWHVADDQMITQRVAYNFWRDGLPYFNQGEAVAASTSLFWPIFLSQLYHIFDHRTAVYALIILSLGLTASSIAIASYLISSRTLQAVLVVAAVASPPVMRYGGSGWEHIPQMFFITVGLMLIAKSSLESGLLKVPTLALILVCVSFLFRVDSAVLIAVIFVCWLFTDNRFTKTASYGIAIGLLVIPAAYLIGMNYYYQDFVPNTAYLKLSTPMEAIHLGVSYILDLNKVWLFPIFVFALIGLTPSLIFKNFLIIVSICQIIYVVLIGGDVFKDARFLLSLLPTVFFFTFHLIETLERPVSPRNLVVAATIVLFTGSSILTEQSGRIFNANEENIAYQDIEGHLRISSFVRCALEPSDGSVGLHYLGTAYHFPEFHAVDFLGKAEPYIARSDPKFGSVGHNKWDYPYAFSRYDIAIIPVLEVAVDEVRRPGFELPEENEVYLLEMSQYVEGTNDYVFFSASTFGNTRTGLYLRQDLTQRVKTAECLDLFKSV
ncbi:MAG: hypothetical protein AAFR98_02950 [Pseudomonadota bacterium]